MIRLDTDMVKFRPDPDPDSVLWGLQGTCNTEVWKQKKGIQNYLEYSFNRISNSPFVRGTEPEFEFGLKPNP